MATSALGTGVDFPGIVFILHVDMPYGMIDFAQESGRAGRAGEDVDSVIVVEKGRVEVLAAKMQSIDEAVMGEFVSTQGCRRAIMSEYLDGSLVECSHDRDLARCDRCGEGVTAMFRAHSQAATERQEFEEGMDELRDGQGCFNCFVHCAASVDGRDWMHPVEECELEGSEGGVVVSKEEVDAFRAKIRFDKRTHSCFKCGISQKLCKTREDSSQKCQWPGIMSNLLRRISCSTEGGRGVVRRCGYEGDWGDWDGYASWLAQADERRVWGEVVSRAMVVVKEFLRWRRRVESDGREFGVENRGRRSANREAEMESEEERSTDGVTGLGLEEVGSRESSEEDRVAEIGTSSMDRDEDEGQRGRGLIRKLREWEGRCVICERVGHTAEQCMVDGQLAAMMQMGMQQMEQMEEPGWEQGRCWVGWVRCERVGRKCRWSRLAGRVGIGLLYAGKDRLRVQEWVQAKARGEFVAGGAEEAVAGLQRFFRRAIEWKGGIASNMLCEMVWEFG